MSRLDSVIRRLKAQRACLNQAAIINAAVPGVVLELGLGNGRTYDHLREKMPEREIYVFERKVAAHPDCVPDNDHLFLGEIHDTLITATAKLAGQAMLIHCDIGCGVEAENRKLADFLGNRLAPLLANGGIVVSDQKIHIPGAQSLPLPEEVPDDRYFMVQMI